MAKKRTKPAKPHADFPLFPHASGKWAKKVRGRMYYFGTWDDPSRALREYLEVKDSLQTGRRRSQLRKEGLTVRKVIEHFMEAKTRQLEAGELSPRSHTEYRLTGDRLIEHFGDLAVVAIEPLDFADYRAKMAKTRGAVSLGNEVQRVRTIFKYAYEVQLIDKPMRFGPEFKRPSRVTVRRAKQAAGPKLFTADQVNALIDEVGIHLRAMVYLGINCGFGNSDCGRLPISGVDLYGGWIDFPRPKTAVPRRIPLWPETVEALLRSSARRPDAGPEAEGLFFVTHDGWPWAKDDSTNPISKRTTAALKRLKIHRTGMSFYWLRHTFATIAAQTGDQIAVNAIMGHADDSMPANYRQEIDDERLLSVVNHVRNWLILPG